MEELQSAFNKFSKDAKSMASSFIPPPQPPPPPPPPLSSYTPAGVIVTRPPRHLVPLWTCSKLCAVFFVAGVFVGYTLKRRVRRWLSKIARRLKDD